MRPVRGELVHLPEQFVGLLVGQRRIRFVEQEHPRVARHGAGDLRALLGRERAIRRDGGREPADAEGVHDLRVVAAPSFGRADAPPSRPTSMFSATVRLGNSCGS